MAFRLVGSGSTRVGLGLLVVRLGVGLSMLVFHGWGKLMGGPENWERLGGNMERLGVTAFPMFWGLMAALAEGVCSALLILGFPFRVAAFLLACTMFVAATRHLSIPAGEPGGGFNGASHALELLAVYVGLLLTGPGKFGLRWTRGTSGE